MATKLNSTFLAKVNEFTENIRNDVKSEEHRGIIVIASEQNAEKTGSDQIGCICGNEMEAVIGLAGFILKPHGRHILVKALQFIENATIEDEEEDKQKGGDE